MAENQAKNSNSDEIDLGQLFQLISKGLNKIFVGTLKTYRYLKKNLLLLLGLAILGAGLGYGLNQIISKKLKTEVIVKPTLESKNYLYDAVDEIEANIKAKNLTFFKNIGISTESIEGFEISIAPVDGAKVSSASEKKFLELLQSFENTEVIADIVRSELKNKSSFNHIITFQYKDQAKGILFAEKVIAYINSNKYFEGLTTLYRANALDRIEENTNLVKQVDEIIANYSKTLNQNNRLSSSDKIVLDNQERIDVTGLLDFKSNLIRDIEAKKIELENFTEPIKVINFGQSQEVRKAFFGKNIVLIPTVFIGLFFLFSLLKYLNKKSSEL